MSSSHHNKTRTRSPASSPSGLRRKAHLSTAAPSAAGNEETGKAGRVHRKKEIPHKTSQKWMLRVFILACAVYPLRFLVRGEPIPLAFNVAYIVALLYTVVFFGLKAFLDNELTVKRLMSGCFSVVLGGVPAYALYFDPELQDATVLFGHSTPSTETAIGLLLGFYCGDMFWITPSQLNIPSLLVHHISVVVFWIWAQSQTLAMTITMLAQMQEICNPFWYFHWIAFSSYAYRDPRKRPWFFVNAFLILIGYLALRLLWVQLRVTQHIWWMVWNYPIDAAFMVPTGIIIETVINMMNIYKLSRSILTAWNTPADKLID